MYIVNINIKQLRSDLIVRNKDEIISTTKYPAKSFSVVFRPNVNRSLTCQVQCRKKSWKTFGQVLMHLNFRPFCTILCFHFCFITCISVFPIVILLPKGRKPCFTRFPSTKLPFSVSLSAKLTPFFATVILSIYHVVFAGSFLAWLP